MITDTKTRIISYIGTNGQARVKDLVNHLGIGHVAVHRHLRALVEAGKLTKAGEPPKVFYRLATPTAEDKRILESKIILLLLIDDAVGSGATLNETAKKLKQMGIAKRVYGFAVVGSLKGFEVIREV